MRALIHVVSPTRHQFILISLALMLFPVPVSAEAQIQTFEDGLTTGWTLAGSSGSGVTKTMSLISGYNSSKALAVKIAYGYPTYSQTLQYAYVYKTVDFTNIDTWTCMFRVSEVHPDPYSAAWNLKIGDSTVASGSGYSTTGWQLKTYNTSGITGNQTVRLYVEVKRYDDDGAYLQVAIDDITVGYTVLEPDPEYIYFDKSAYNITNTAYIHYDRCYDHENLGWRWGGLLEPVYYAEDYLYLNVNAGDTYNDSWTNYRHVYGRKLSYTDLGNCWQSDNFLIASDLAGWRLNVTLEKRTDLYAGVYGVYGRYLGTSVEVIDSDLAYVIGSKPDNITEGDPVIDMPIVPDYESNYTPPQPQPGDNSTLGTSFLGGYYQTVDSIIGPINNTGSGALYFVMSPVTTFSSSVVLVNGYATSTFDRVLFYVSPFGLFFTVIFDAIPDDTEIIIMFSLVCGLILIVLRWK